MSNLKGKAFVYFKRLPRFPRTLNKKEARPLFRWPPRNWGQSPIFLSNFRDDDAGEVFLLEHGVERGEVFGQDPFKKGFLLS
jgi:hypothetical protein